MRINNNLMAMNTHRQLGTANAGGAKSMEKLSSGLRINRAGDDAAGLAISEKMRGQIRGLTQASANSQDGISLIQTAEGALNETHAILQRMRELAVQSSTDTNVGVDRSEIQKEMNELIDEIDRIAEQTQFNEQNLLDGSFSEKKFHIGANEGQNVELSVNAMGSGATGATEFYQITGSATPASFDFSGSNADVTFKVGDNSVKIDSDVSDIDGLVTALDGKLGDDVKVTKDTSGELVFTSSKAFKLEVIEGSGTVPDVKVATGDAAKIDVKYSITGSATPASFDFSGSNADVTFKVGDNSVKIDSDVSDIDGLVTALDGKLGDDVKVTKDTSGELVFTSSKAFKLEVIEGSGTVPDVKVATGDATSNAPAGLDLGSGAGGGLGVGSLKVADANKDSTGGIMTQDEASKAITTIQTAIESVSAERSKLGAMQNRLEHTIKNLDTSSENLQASEARIRDVDMAKEMMEQTKQNILSQASTAMLAQANQAPQGVLQLLR